MTEKEIKALLADMTLKEKIGQLTQLDASCFNDEGPVTGAETELGIPAEDFPYAGSVLGVTAHGRWKNCRKCVWKNSRITSRCCLWQILSMDIRQPFLFAGAWLFF